MKCPFILLLLVALMLGACKNTGFYWSATPDLLTPNTSADTTVRVWDTNGQPHDTEVPNDPAFSK